MPKEIVISKEKIVKAGLELIQEHGLSILSARKIATKLKCSTMPIYSHFKNIEELVNKVMEKAIDRLWEYMDHEYDKTYSFFNMGVGYIIFARDNPKLFRTLFLETNKYQNVIDDFTNAVVVKMKNDPRFTDWIREDRRILFNKLNIFAHGYATMLCVGTIKYETDEEIMKYLHEVGITIILSEFSNREK